METLKHRHLYNTDETPRTFAYSAHCLFANAGVTVDSSWPYETDTTFGGATIPQDSGPTQFVRNNNQVACQGERSNL